MLRCLVVCGLLFSALINKAESANSIAAHGSETIKELMATIQSLTSPADIIDFTMDVFHMSRCMAQMLVGPVTKPVGYLAKGFVRLSTSVFGSIFGPEINQIRKWKEKLLLREQVNKQMQKKGDIPDELPGCQTIMNEDKKSNEASSEEPSDLNIEHLPLYTPGSSESSNAGSSDSVNMSPNTSPRVSAMTVGFIDKVGTDVTQPEVSSKASIIASTADVPKQTAAATEKVTSAKAEITEKKETKVSSTPHLPKPTSPSAGEKITKPDQEKASGPGELTTLANLFDQLGHMKPDLPAQQRLVAGNLTDKGPKGLLSKAKPDGSSATELSMNDLDKIAAEYKGILSKGMVPKKAKSRQQTPKADITTEKQPKEVTTENLVTKGVTEAAKIVPSAPQQITPAVPSHTTESEQHLDKSSIIPTKQKPVTTPAVPTTISEKITTVPSVISTKSVIISTNPNSESHHVTTEHAKDAVNGATKSTEWNLEVNDAAKNAKTTPASLVTTEAHHVTSEKPAQEKATTITQEKSTKGEEKATTPGHEANTGLTEKGTTGGAQKEDITKSTHGIEGEKQGGGKGTSEKACDATTKAGTESTDGTEDSDTSETPDGSESSSKAGSPAKHVKYVRRRKGRH